MADIKSDFGPVSVTSNGENTMVTTAKSADYLGNAGCNLYTNTLPPTVMRQIFAVDAGDAKP